MNDKGDGYEETDTNRRQRRHLRQNIDNVWAREIEQQVEEKANWHGRGF